MQQNPGVYIGAWPIPLILNYANHTAVAESNGSSVIVTELIGWYESAYNLIHSNASVPHYGGAQFSTYRWVRVAGLSSIPSVQQAAQEASFVYSGHRYWLTSNRFVSAIMSRAGINITAEILSRLGRSPGICACNSCGPS